MHRIDDRTRGQILRMAATRDIDGKPRFSQREIADRFCVHERTVSREIRQGFMDCYRQDERGNE